MQTPWPWTISREPNGFSGHCPVRPDFVQDISGQCPHFPLSPWILSRKSMDIVQGDSGQCPVCPLSPWTLSSLSGLPGLCPEYPWTLSRLSTDSMDNVQGVHGHCPGSRWIQWTFYRRASTIHLAIEKNFFPENVKNDKSRIFNAFPVLQVCWIGCILKCQ